MNVYDSFIFMNEVDCLNIRLHELSSLVHRFVIAELPVTFQGKRRELTFPKLLADKNSLPYKHINKIIYLTAPYDKVVDKVGNFKIPNKVEKFQRNLLLTYLQTIPNDDDYVIHGDCDEIPSYCVVKEISRMDERKRVIITKLYRYYYNLYFQDWNHLFMEQAVGIKGLDCLDDHRKHRVNNYPKAYGGWHFSPVGDFNFMMNKWKTFSRMGRAKHNPHKLNKQWMLDRVRKRLHPYRDDKPEGTVCPIKDMPSYIIQHRNDKHIKPLLAPLRGTLPNVAKK
jgi:beta-1,4-mannosyl-glycoprotein beta-1,4-N-acetylglucosaminyltransferase